ncbi:MAG: glycerophosphodiester phosphodiesterase [Dehalococcoidia bacterium]|nr:glycerophosphodiester phosphodiesterase [Dehalococcoidia bacterium]
MNTDGRPPVRIAHAYGNSKQSLDRALQAPVDVIEVDVWHRGGDLYIHHERRLGPLPVLADKRMRGHPPGRFTVPLWNRYYLRPDVNRLHLRELLRTVDGGRHLLLDLKGSYRGKRLEECARTLAGVIREHAAQGWVAVCGQDFGALDGFRAAAPDIEVRYSMEQPQQWRRFQEMVTNGEPVRRICIEHRFLDDEKLRFIQREDVSLYCWTVDDAMEAERLVAAGADGIISNDLTLLASLHPRQPASG